MDCFVLIFSELMSFDGGFDGNNFVVCQRQLNFLLFFYYMSLRLFHFLLATGVL